MLGFQGNEIRIWLALEWRDDCMNMVSDGMGCDFFRRVTFSKVPLLGESLKSPSKTCNSLRNKFISPHISNE